MNEQLFLRFQHAADSELLEEAMEKPEKTGGIRYMRPLALAAAACVCLSVGFALWRGRGEAKSMAADSIAPAAAAESAPEENASEEPKIMMTLANPVHESSAEELESLGYKMAIPAGAGDAAYTFIDRGGDAEPLAQATFTLHDTQYTYRALKTDAAEDISGLYDEWDESLSWKVGTLQLELRRSDEYCWIGWYAPEEGVQCCLSGGNESKALLETARVMARDLGQDLSLAPAGSQDVSGSVFTLDGKTVAETGFTLNGVRWTYRTAATGALELEDISGLADGDYAACAQGEVSWCPAQLRWNEGGGGKILWFDIVPGLVYSLSCDASAGEQALLDMAGSLFVPAQGDAG